MERPEFGLLASLLLFLCDDLTTSFSLPLAPLFFLIVQEVNSLAFEAVSFWSSVSLTGVFFAPCAVGEVPKISLNTGLVKRIPKFLTVLVTVACPTKLDF